MDLTATSDFVQHVAAFKAQLHLVQHAAKQVRSVQIPSADIAAQPVHDDAASASSTAFAAAEEECVLVVVDLREAAVQLDKRKFEEKAKLLECVDNNAIIMLPDRR